MEGLLEPYGDLLKEFGVFQTKNNIEKLLNSFRVLIEEIISNKDAYFNGNYPEDGLQDAIDSSKILVKNHFFK